MVAKKSAPKATKSKKAAAAKPAAKPVAKKAAPKKSAPVAKKPATKPAVVAAKRDVAQKSSQEAEKLLKKPVVVAAPAAKPVRTAATVTRLPVAETAEDSEVGDSLLAGPRNVQPYVAKRGEQYMNKEQLEHFRKILQSWKQDLMLEVDRTVSHMKDEAANFPDPNDRATQEEEFSLELRTRDRERKLIRKIDEALGRIEDGSYGYCLETGEQIGVKRLEARPVATLSIEAQERRERREKQYGDRDDRYR
jgi:DnaK suppressor protein